MKRFAVLLIAMGALLAGPVAAQGTSGFASFIEGFAKGKRQADESKLIQAETERLRAETELLRASRKTTQPATPEMQWDLVIGDFLDRAKTMDGIDYLSEPTKRQQLDLLIRYYGQKASDNGMVDGADLKASRWALEQAHAVMIARKQ